MSLQRNNKCNVINHSFFHLNTLFIFLLGGWLLMEPWITPTIFEEVNVGELENKIVDEYTYAQYVDRDFAKQRLNRYTTDCLRCHY